MATSAYKCPYCSCNETYCAPSQILLERHIKYVHSQEPVFRIECKQPFCTRIFSNYHTYQNHLIQHKNDSEVETSEELDSQMQSDSRMDFEVRSDEKTSNDRAHSVNNYLPDFTDYCAKWILKTSETKKLTTTATVGIVEDVADLVKEVSSCLADQVKSCLTENGVDFNAIVGLSA